MNFFKSLFPRYGSFLFITLIYLFFYIPIAVLITFSFNKTSFPSPWSGFTLNWYVKLFHSTELWRSFFNSMFVAICSTCLSLCLSLLLIFFRACGGNIRKAIPLFYGNLMIPETVLAVSLLSYFTFFNIPLGLTTIIIAHSIIGLGFAAPIMYSRYLNISADLKEASLTLGANSYQTFFKITVPLLKPTMIATGLLIFILSFDDFILTYFLAGTSVQTLSLYLISMIRAGISPVVNALSGILLLFSTALVIFFFSPKLRSKIF